MQDLDKLYPNINDGRFFISPILGCVSSCSYCYLPIKDYHVPRKNPLSNQDYYDIASVTPEFVFGSKGTIISVGAWGDLFPRNNDSLKMHSIQVIKSLLSWGNPVQIMSKNQLDAALINEISKEVRYPNQLLYSSTIVTIDKWKQLEPGASAPIDRLKTCLLFHENGIPTNILLKPFLSSLTADELPTIADHLLSYNIDFCTVGVMYLNAEIQNRISKKPFLTGLISNESFSFRNHLDCNGDELLESTKIETLLPYICYLRKRGINAFLKSSCINAVLLNVKNSGKYFEQKSPYCINCGNCNILCQEDREVRE